MSKRPLIGDNVHHVALLVMHKVHFLCLEIDVATLVAFVLQNFRKRFHFQQVVHYVGVLRFDGFVTVEHCLHGGVGKTVFTAYYRRENVALQNLSPIVDCHATGKSQPVYPLVQRANTVGKFPRKHGEHRFGEIHAGTTGKSLFVYGVACLYIV